MREKTHSEHLGRFDSANPVTETELYVPILEIAEKKMDDGTSTKMKSSSTPHQNL